MSYALNGFGNCTPAQQTSCSFEDSEEVIVQFDSTVRHGCKLSKQTRFT